MGLRWLILTVLIMGPFMAEARSYQQAENQFVSLLSALQRPTVREATYRCYDVGRLQGFADILANDISKLMSFTSKKPEVQASLIGKLQELHVKADRVLATQTPVCDQLFREHMRQTRAGQRNVVAQLKELTKRFRGTAAEDPVVACFHSGRLNYLKHLMHDEMRAAAIKGRKISDELQILSNRSEANHRKFSEGCIPALGGV